MKRRNKKELLVCNSFFSAVAVEGTLSRLLQWCFYRAQHILNEDAVAGGGVAYHNVRDGANQLAVLDDR